MKSNRTEMMLPPTMEECVAAAVKLGMPEAEGRKFFYHYESNGWKVGRLVMKSFAGAMGGWHERWLERGSTPPTAKFQSRYVNGTSATLSGADKMVLRDEYQRLSRRLEALASYDHLLLVHIEERKKLRLRRQELQKLLGVTI